MRFFRLSGLLSALVAVLLIAAPLALAAESGEEDQEISQGDVGRYGVGVLNRVENKQVVVVRVFKGYPADRAGIKVGDVFLSIDGFSLHDVGLEEVTNRFRGPRGTYVQVKVLRKGGKQAVPYTLAREYRWE